MRNDMVKHKGVVQQVEDARLLVKIMQTSACSSCTAKGHCAAAESKEHLIEVNDLFASRYQAGEEVWVIGSEAMGRQAVVYGFVLPFFIVVIALFVFSFLFSNELMAGVCALACAVPYYLVLYFNKDKMKRKFSFSVLPIE